MGNSVGDISKILLKLKNLTMFVLFEALSDAVDGSNKSLISSNGFNG